MKKMKLFEEVVQDECGETREFAYYVLVELIECQGLQCENYGVAVEEKEGDQVEILGITTSQQRIESLLRLLSKHQVSPIALGDVVADWL